MSENVTDPRHLEIVARLEAEKNPQVLKASILAEVDSTS